MKVKLIRATREECDNWDCRHDHPAAFDPITDWEECTDEDYEFLLEWCRIHNDPGGRRNRDRTYHIIVQEELNLPMRIKEVKESVEKEMKKKKEKEKKATIARKKREETRKKKQKEKEKQLLKDLQTKYGDK